MTSPRRQLEQKIDDVIEAYKKLRTAEHDPDLLPGSEQVDDILTGLEDAVGDTQYEREAEADAEEWRRSLPPYVEPFMDAHWGESVREIVDALDDVEHKLRENSGVEEGTDPNELIATGIAGWDSPAADIFRQDHLPHLDNALRYQLEFAQALKAVIQVHAAVVEMAFRQAKDLLQQAIEALDEEAERQEREDRRRLMESVGSLVTAGIAGAGGGPGAAIIAGLEGVGQAVAELDFDPSGDSGEIMNGLQDALRGLSNKIEREQEEICYSIEQLDKFLNGDRAEEFLPLPIDPELGVSTTGSGAVPPRPPAGAERHG
jgi:ribosomal protein L7/L12